jgi:hypothetical protein
MRSLRVSFALFLPAFGVVLPQAHAEFSLFKQIWGDVIVATDTTEEGHALTPPTPDQPVYYVGRSLGHRLGSIRGDDEPEDRQITRFVAGILAKQGYLGARPGVNEPTMLLMIQWGWMSYRTNDLHWFLGYDSRQDIGAKTIDDSTWMGPEVFRQYMRSPAIDTILADARSDLYGIIVTAFEYKSVGTPKPVIYWQTRIGLPSNGKTMAAALPAMLVAAGPAIGRPADSPVFASADNARRGSVTLGDLKFLDVLPEPSHSSPVVPPRNE